SVEQAEYMLMPRMLAVAEVAWSPLKKKNFKDFLKRIPKQLGYLDRIGVHFRIPEPEGLSSDTTSRNRIKVNLRSYVPDSKIYYTLDGSDPTTGSALYKSPI